MPRELPYPCYNSKSIQRTSEQSWKRSPSYLQSSLQRGYQVRCWGGRSACVKFSRSPSYCWDPVRSKIDPLLLLWLHSDHPPILQHYANQNPKLQVPPKPSDTFLSLSELWMTSENPDHISVFICLHCSVLVLLNSEFIFMSSSQFSPFHFQYIKLFQYSCSLILASALPSYITTSLLLNSLNSL